MLSKQLKGSQAGIEVKLIFMQVTLASDDGIYTSNNPEKLSEEDILYYTSTEKE